MSRQTFTVRQIAAAAGVGQERIEYVLAEEVLDSKYLPRSESRRAGRGVTRRFGWRVALPLTLAGALLRAGLSGPAVRHVLNSVLAWAGQTVSPESGPRRSVLQMLALGALTDRLTIETGDGEALRVLLRPLDSTKQPRGSGSEAQPQQLDWQRIADGEPLGDGYMPAVVIRVNLGVLSRRLSGS